MSPTVAAFCGFALALMLRPGLSAIVDLFTRVTRRRREQSPWVVDGIPMPLPNDPRWEMHGHHIAVFNGDHDFRVERGGTVGLYAFGESLPGGARYAVQVFQVLEQRRREEIERRVMRAIGGE